MKQVYQIFLLLLVITQYIGCGELDANRMTGRIRVVDPEGNPAQDPSILLNVSFTPMQSYHLYEGRPSRTEDLKPDAVGIFSCDVWASSVGLIEDTFNNGGWPVGSGFPNSTYWNHGHFSLIALPYTTKFYIYLIEKGDL